MCVCVCVCVRVCVSGVRRNVGNSGKNCSKEAGEPSMQHGGYSRARNTDQSHVVNTNSS